MARRDFAAGLFAALLIGACGDDPADPFCPVDGVIDATVAPVSGRVLGAAEVGTATPLAPPTPAAFRTSPLPPACGRLVFDITSPDTSAWAGQVAEIVEVRAIEADDFAGVQAGTILWSSGDDGWPENARIGWHSQGPEYDLDVWVTAQAITRPGSGFPPNILIARDSVQMTLQFRPSMQVHPAQRVRIDLSASGATPGSPAR